MERKKIFFTILYVLSFIIMLVGSTLAYFSFRTVSDSGVVDVNSAVDSSVTVSIAQVAGGGDLYPLKDEDIMLAYNRNCLDVYGRSACNKYAVNLRNGDTVNYLNGKIKFVLSNNLVNLYFMVLDSNENVIVPTTQIVNDEYYSIGDSLKMLERSNFEYILVVWLRNVDEEQNSEMAGTYNGTISYNAVTDSRLINEIESSYVGG